MTETGPIDGSKLHLVLKETRSADSFKSDLTTTFVQRDCLLSGLLVETEHTDSSRLNNAWKGTDRLFSKCLLGNDRVNS